MGYASEDLTLVLNRADTNVGISEQDVETLLGRRPDVLVPSDRAIPRAITEGQPIVVAEPNRTQPRRSPAWPGGTSSQARSRRARELQRCRERLASAHARREAELIMELHERLSTNGSAAEAWGNGNDPFAELKNRIHLALVSELGPRLFDVADSDAVRVRVVSEIDDQLRQEVALSRDDRERLAGEIADDIFGYGPLERLLSDSSISEIMVNGPHEIFIERHGRLSETTLRFTDASHLRRIITKMVGQVGRRIDESSPLVDARLPDGSRVNAIIPPLSLSGPLLTIRKFRQDRFDIAELVQLGTLSDARRLPQPLHRGGAQHPRLGRNRLGQDDAAECSVGGGPRARPDRDDRGRGRAPALAAARPAARGTPEEHRGRR